MNYELINPINEQYTVVQQILTNRGIAFNDIEHYLNTSKQDNLSPLKLKYIENAAKTLIKHLLDPEAHIDLIVDCDADGFLSSALMLNYLHARWPSSTDKIRYILHDNKIHGIELDKLNKDVTLVLVPDASSNEYAIHQELNEKGIDVLILDHHIAERISEYACVVNNQLCDYPNKALCGCGIVYKLCQYIDHMLEDDGFVDERFLDIVAVANISDMMSLRSFETHYLVQEGLKQLRNPFIRGMAEKNAYSLGDILTPIGVAFYITPLINAITRVGTMEEKELLLQSMLDYKADELVSSTKRGHKGEMETILEQSLRTCTNVKNRQTRQQDIAVEQIEEIIKRDNLTAHKIMIVKIENPDFDLSITGLIANKIMGKYCQPICLIHPSKDEEGIWVGSMRACGVQDFRSFCEESGFVEWCQGHPSAAGFCIHESRIPAFVDYCDIWFKDINFTPNYKVDFIYDSMNLKDEDILQISSMESFWGQDLPEPLIAVKNIQITKDMLQLMAKDRNPTLKISLDNISCIKFKSSEEEFNNLYSEDGCVTVTIIGTCQANRYNGNVTPQIIIKDYEIINVQEYYF